MANWTPAESGAYLPISSIFANADVDATLGGSGGIFIPYGNLSSFDGSTTDDFREFLYSVVDATYDYYVDVNTALTADGSGVLGNLTMSRGVDSSNLLNETTPTITKTFTISTVLNVAGVTYDVAEEVKPS